MFKKRGQLTIFIIIAIVLIATVSLIYFIYPKIKITGAVSDPISEYVESCIRDSIINSAQILGYQQGYNAIPQNYLDTGLSSLAYYYYEGEIIIPENDFFERELSDIIDSQLNERCTDFLFLEVEGFLVELGRNSNSVEILEDTINVRVDFPIAIIDGEEVSRFSKFSYEIPIRLGHIFDVSRNLVDKIKEEPYATDLGFFLNQDVDISIDEFDECNQIYIILDPESESTEEEESYVYSFAVKIEDEFCVFENEF